MIEISSEKIIQKLIESNKSFTSNHEVSWDSGKPRMRLAILTCMDCRINPFAICDISVGDAHVIRNAGARVTEDSIRSVSYTHLTLPTKRSV